MGIKHGSGVEGTKVTETVWLTNHIIDGDVVPATTNVYDLGSSTYKFAEASIMEVKNLHTVRALTNYIQFADSTVGVSAGLYNMNLTTFGFSPAADNTGYLGTSATAWKGVNAYDAISKTATTGLSFKWKDTPEQALSLADQAASVTWADLDLTATTSANAKMALIQLVMDADVIGGGTSSKLEVRKNGTTPTYTPSIFLDVAGCTVDVPIITQQIIGLDSGQVMEYQFTCGAGWTCDLWINVLGYWE
jgi:hypothetical protein